MERTANPLAVTAIVFSLLYVASSLYRAWSTRRVLSKIPTIGESGILSSYIGAYKALYNARDMIQEGYNKYRGAVFKIPGVSKWIVVVSGRQMVDEIRKATDDHINIQESLNETLQTLYTMGPEICYDSYHIQVIKASLTRSLAERFPDVQNEISAAFEEYIPQTEDWTSVLAFPTIRQIVARSSIRLFVGLPLCQNPDFRKVNIEFNINVIKAAQVINLSPDFLKPFVGRYLAHAQSRLIQRAMAHLRPIIEERLGKEAEYGKDWPERPNDALSWLLNLAEGKQRTIRDLTMRILVLNLGIHTISIAFTQILFDLAANPSFVPALREEVERVIREEGLSNASFHKMVKLDSFIKESQRLGGIGAVVMQRKVLRDFTFSDGTVIPKGNDIVVANFAMHHDEEKYPDASTFDGFRFSKMREQQTEGFSKHQMVALTHEYIVFGYGKHACPGRWFVVNELKALLAYTLLNYDVSFKDNGPRPADCWFSLAVSPDPNVSVMFRKRRS